MTATVFNEKNDGYLSGKYPLYLGNSLGLFDSINVKYPVLEDLYELQRSCRWVESEVDLSTSRMDLLRSADGEVDIMVKTLAYLWELDSVASRAVYPLFAPFITNSELSALKSEWTAMETIHAKTYSEIIRQCVPDTKQAIEEVVKNEQVLERADTVIRAFDDLQLAGGLRNSGKPLGAKEERKMILLGQVALYLLERVQFMSSFAIIFCLAETNKFIGIAKLVQLICRDELLHAQMSSEIIKILRQDPEWESAFQEIKDDIYKMIDEVVSNEMKWNEYLFTGDRKMVGLNAHLLNEWVLYCNQDLMSDLKLDNPYDYVNELPIKWVMNWIDFDKTQNANQEMDNTQYRMNSVEDDIGDEVFEI